MIVKRFYNEPLAHAAYLVGCAGTGDAAVIDPGQDLEPILEYASSQGLTITAVTETHIHADFLSGARELAKRTGAMLFLTDEGPADWKYSYANEPYVTLVKHGDVIRVGNLRLDVWHTPGHTPEHITFVLTDEPASPEPVIAFTGDFIFVGDVGRPDLLERAAGFKGTMEAGAKVLYGSLAKFLEAMPDHLLIYPAHGAGSACGKSLGGVPVSALGFEKKVNWGLKVKSEDKFVDEVLSGQPEPPRYFAQMKMRNKDGLTSPTMLAAPARLGINALDQLPQNIQMVDLRPVEQFTNAHLSGSISLPLNKGFVNFAGALLAYDTPILFVANDAETARLAARDLGLIGLDQVVGWVGPDVLRNSEQLALAEVTCTEAIELQSKANATILDVRGRTEFALGHFENVAHIPLPELTSRISELDPNQTVIVHCQGGVRSPIAASWLLSKGFKDVRNIPDGYQGCQARLMANA